MGKADARSEPARPMLSRPSAVDNSEWICADGSDRLRFLSRDTLKSLLFPGAVWLLAVMALVYSDKLTLPLPALSFLYYCAILAGMLLAWKFHSSRTFWSLAVLLLAQQAAAISGGQPPYIPSTLHALTVVVPLNFVLIAMMHESGFTLESAAPLALFLFTQALTLTVFCGAGVRTRNLPVPLSLPRYAVLVLAAAAVLLVARFLVKRSPVESALLWSLGAAVLALRYAAAPRISTAYWSAAACILASAVIERSYLLAYHDELTGLPSRRSFNDSMLRLKFPYSIAVVDIDHFKSFNDTYGHDTGDQVLCLVASHLSRVTGGGHAYRCGGEEFNILFQGKTTTEVLPHLERLRETIQNAEFRMRGGDRRQTPRGPDRRNARNRRKSRKQQAGTQAADGNASVLSVTVSIGVATSTSGKSTAEIVLGPADKALYKAKANGRNRVETATSSARRTRTKAVGIA